MNHEELNLKNCKKIAVMGGTFDPIHYGHLVAAEAVRHEFGAERVLFIPTGRPPHKIDGKISDGEHRYLMAVLATATNPFFYVSRLEIERTGYTYTIDTIKSLKNMCKKGAKIYFITGADALHQILTWKNAEELLGLCDFVAVTRPGYNKEKLFLEIDNINRRYESKLHFLEVPALSISSSDIRHRVKSGRPIKYLLPESVCEYICKYGLYSEGIFQESVKAEMTEKRYIHTLGVVEEAAKLAEAYGEDIEKARLAALFHDLAKDYPNEEKKRLCKEYGIKLDDAMKKRLDLTHGLLSAEIAKKRYSIKDKNLLNAIRYHTTGRKNMSVLEKIIYIADYIEPNREPFEGLEEVREMAYANLDKAFLFALEMTIKYNENRILHPLSIEALNFEKEKVN